MRNYWRRKQCGYDRREEVYGSRTTALYRPKHKVAELFEKLYEDNMEGKVTDEWFLQLSHKYEVEHMELKERIAELRGSISDLDSIQTKISLSMLSGSLWRCRAYLHHYSEN